MSVTQSVQLMKKEGARLAPAVPVEGMPPMTFSCSFDPDTVSQQDLRRILPECSQDMAEFWGISRTARLFEDQEYGQWGLEILTPECAVDETSRLRAERSNDFMNGDLVIGRFLGDSDLLVLRTDPTAKDFGRVVVALPIDSRAEWYHAAESFGEFLDSYVKAGGGKYWADT